MPRDNIGHGISTGDEKQLRVWVARTQIPQRIDSIGIPTPIDVHAAHPEAWVGSSGDHRHQITRFRRSNLLIRFLPRLPRRHKQHRIQGKLVRNLASGNQVTVVDRVKGTAHHADALRGFMLHSTTLLGSLATIIRFSHG